METKFDSSNISYVENRSQRSGKEFIIKQREEKGRVAFAVLLSEECSPNIDIMSSSADEQEPEDEGERQESGKKRPHQGDDSHESDGTPSECKQRRLASEDDIPQAPPSQKHDQVGDARIALGMEPIVPLAALPGMADNSNAEASTTANNFVQPGTMPSTTENQNLPMVNPIFAGHLSIGAQMAGMGMQTNSALFQQQLFLAANLQNRSFSSQLGMPPSAIQPQHSLTQQPSLTAQQALTAASSVSIPGRDTGQEPSSAAPSSGVLGETIGQNVAAAMPPPQPQHPMLQPPQQQPLTSLPAGALPQMNPGGVNPMQLQFLQRSGIPAPLTDEAAALCNRMLLSGFPLAGGIAMPPLFAQQINRPRQEMPLLAVPTPRADGVCLALACDDEQLSEYQILVRKQLEIFEAQQEDVESNTQGRKKQVVLGQVGIRCRHCSGLPLRQRGRGAVYYPAKLQGVYQAAQNMASSHLCESCQYIPHAVKQDLRLLRERRDTASGGKQYWADGARAMGLYESEEGLKLRRGPVSADDPTAT